MGETEREGANKQVSGSLPGHDAQSPSASAASSHETSRHDIETVIESPRLVSSVVISDSVPETFGRYRIVKLLGEGAMGSVYLAEDTQLRRQVALKVPKFSADASPALLERFYREARAAAALNHSDICSVYDVGEINSQHYITMAYIEGRPLSDCANRDKAQSQRQVAIIIRKLATALQEAHNEGVIHRDLKPANIMIDKKNEPVIMDFGLARQFTQEGERLTQSGALIGSPAYMPPEQVEGEIDQIGPHSDIYSLGVTLYELLTCTIPFKGSIGSVMGQILKDEPKPPREILADVDPQRESICLKMMSKQIADRPHSMTDVASQLARWLNSSKPTDSAASLKSVSQSKRSRLVIGCCLALLVVFVGWLAIGSNDDKQQVSKGPAVSDGSVGQQPGLSVNNDNQGQPSRSDFSLSVDIKGEAVVDKKGLVQLVEAQKFIVEIVADRDCYLGVWYIDDAGTVVQLFPNEHESDHLIRSGKPRRIPGEDSYAIEATISKTTEWLHVVVSTKRWNPFAGETVGPYVVFSGSKKKEWQSQVRGLTIVKPNQSNAVAEKIIPFRVVAASP
jgi:serine/threonine protein kinase